MTEWTWVPVIRKEQQAAKLQKGGGRGGGNGNGQSAKQSNFEKKENAPAAEVEKSPTSTLVGLLASEQIRCVNTIKDIYTRLPPSSREPFAEHVCEQLGTQANLLIRLCHERARDLVKDMVGYKPMTVAKNDPLHKVLKMMTQTNILAFPVLEGSTYCGFLDASHLVNYACQLCSVNTKNTIGLSKNRTFRMTSVDQIMGISPPGIPYNSSVCLAFELMAQTGLRRVPIVNFYNNVIGVVTQSMLIEWLVKNINAINPAYRNMPATSVKAYQWVAYAKENDTVLQAFLKMQKMGVQGLAVIDATGKLVDQVSFRDLRGLGTASLSFSMMLEPVKTLRAAVRNQFPDKDDIEGCSISQMCILKSESLERTLHRMVQHKLRRVFVVDSMEHLKPENTISQTDIIRYMMNSLSRTATLSAPEISKPNPQQPQQPMTHQQPTQQQPTHQQPTHQQPRSIKITTEQAAGGCGEEGRVEPEGGKIEADREIEEKAQKVAALIWNFVNQPAPPEQDQEEQRAREEEEELAEQTREMELNEEVKTSTKYEHVTSISSKSSLRDLTPERVRHLVVPRTPKKQRSSQAFRARNPTRLVFPPSENTAGRKKEKARQARKNG